MRKSPKQWRRVLLGEIISPERKIAVPSSGSTLPFIGMDNVESKTGVLLSTGRACEMVSASAMVRKGDVLYGRLRPYLNKVAIASEDSYASGEFIVFRGNENITASFLKMRLLANDFVQYATYLNTGDRPRVKWPQIADFSLLLPPLEEQRRIVTILEDHFACLDAASKVLQTSHSKSDLLLNQYILKQLLGGKITADNSALLAERPPRLPKGWKWTVLSQVAEVVGGVAKDKKTQSDPAIPAVPYLRVANVQRGHIDLSIIATIRVSLEKANRLRLQKGDVLLNEGGDRDKLARGWVWEEAIKNCIHQNHVFRARPDLSCLDPYWLAWIANTLGAPWAQAHGKQSVNLASISLSTIRQMPIPLPPLCEQQAILNRINMAAGSHEQFMGYVRSVLKKIDLLRCTLLRAAFRGDLTANLRKDN